MNLPFWPYVVNLNNTYLKGVTSISAACVRDVVPFLLFYFFGFIEDY